MPNLFSFFRKKRLPNTTNKDKQNPKQTPVSLHRYEGGKKQLCTSKSPYSGKAQDTNTARAIQLSL